MFLPGKNSLTRATQPSKDPITLFTLLKPSFLLNIPARFNLVRMYSTQSPLPTVSISS